MVQRMPQRILKGTYACFIVCYINPTIAESQKLADAFVLVSHCEKTRTGSNRLGRAPRCFKGRDLR